MFQGIFKEEKSKIFLFLLRSPARSLLLSLSSKRK